MIFPGIWKATLAMAYDNGAVNAERSESELAADLLTWVNLRPRVITFMLATDRWLDGLSEEDLSTVCCGEEAEADALIRKTGAPIHRHLPRYARRLLNDIFEQVL